METYSAEELKEISEVKKSLIPLFEKAEKEQLWFRSRYQGLYVSPEELKKCQNEGRFLWGAVNWELQDPMEHLEYLEGRAIEAAIEVDKFKTRMKI